MQHRVMFQGEGRNLSVSHEISRGAERFQELKNLRDMIGSGFKNLNDGLRLPGADVLSSFDRTHGIAKCAHAGGDPHETEHDNLR
jgi:hypothetical protein